MEYLGQEILPNGDALVDFHNSETGDIVTELVEGYMWSLGHEFDDRELTPAGGVPEDDEDEYPW